MSEIAWLIELNLPHATWSEWFMAGARKTGRVEFDRDANKAVRFSRCQDAQAVLDWLSVHEKLLVMHENVPSLYKVTEHMWVDSAKATIDA